MVLVGAVWFGLAMSALNVVFRSIISAPFGEKRQSVVFLAGLADENIQDQFAYLSNQTDATEQREVSLRLLRHFASAVRHRKYSGIDIVTVEVEGSR